MNKINQHNYEAFYLDYLEGNLSAEATAQLFLFLENNPVLKSELEEFELIELNANLEIKFDKETLQQNINKSNVEDYIIASIENEIEAEDALELTNYLNNSAEAMALAKRYEKTILSKQKILFPEKNKLIKKGAVIYYITPLISAAAVVLIFLLLIPLATEKQYSPIGLQQVENNETNTFNFELPAKESVIVAELKTVEEPDFVISTKTENPVKLANIEENNLELNSVVPKETVERISHQSESVIAENQEFIKLKKLETKTIKSIGNHWQQSIAIINRPEITNKIAENATQSVIETQQEPKASSTKNRKIYLWKIAELGLKGFNKLNEKDFAVKPNYTSSGQLKSVTIITDKRKITTPAI
ncbi:MAG: hypothetical protein KAT68_05070 [Bacteroidales bacterium]|nr:hypothetical protein [Bacteroidales bacterium]